MKRSAGSALVSVALCVVTIPACLGTETGNPPFTPEIGYGGYEPMGLSPDPALSEARVMVEEVMIVDCDGARFPMLRRASIDFVAGSASVAETFEIPSGQYCSVQVVVSACENPDLCRVVAPESVAITGVRRVDAADVEIRDQATVDIGLAGSFEMSAAAGGVLFALDRNALLAPVSVSTLPVETDGVARIDAVTNADRLSELRQGLRAALTLRRDLDGDGALDREEIETAPLAEAVGIPAP